MMLNLSLCNYSGVYIPGCKIDKDVIFKNCAPVAKYTSEINNT